MRREYYTDSIAKFRTTSPDEILGKLVRGSGFAIEQTQHDAWLEEINILRQVLSNHNSQIYFEYAIPRMGKRIDVVLLMGSVIFVLEFKVDEREFTSSALDQVCDCALDLKNLSLTSDAIDDIIRASKEGAFKSICFVTGVPGAGKTLVGLNTATKHHDKQDGLYSVFLSGNGPLVVILREALERDNIQNEKEQGAKG